MQYDVLRAFPYPVLRDGVDDYVEGAFQAVVDLIPSADGQELKAEVTFVVSVEELKAEVTSDRAKYVVVFACRDTYFRYVHETDSVYSEINFPSGQFRGEVELYPYILAVAPIIDYNSKWINPEFGPGPFAYPVGAVLAVADPQVVYIDRDVFRSLSSVFVLVKDDSMTGYEWHVRGTADKVQIVLSPELKEVADAARNSKAHRAVLMNSIYFGAVMHCIATLKSNQDGEADTRWGKVILQRCHNEGIDIQAHDDYIIAQRLMKSPFQLVKAYVFQGGGV